MLLPALAASEPTPLLWSALPVGAYLVGTVPTAHLIARTRGIDLGTVGSRNYGATNLGRTLGRTFGIACFAVDAAKGAAAVLAAGALLGTLGVPATESATSGAWCWLATAGAAIAGHTLSPWIGFKGGKGVATGFGALAAMWPVMTGPALQALAIWVALVLAFRMVSLASIAAAWSVPCALLVKAALGGGVLEGVRAAGPYLVASLLIAAFVTFKHRANIARIRAGTESKVLGKKPGDAARDAAGARTDPSGPEAGRP